MSLTKEDVSDLQSHIDLLIQRKVDCERAKADMDAATRNLETFPHYQQYPEQKKK